MQSENREQDRSDITQIVLCRSSLSACQVRDLALQLFLFLKSSIKPHKNRNQFQPKSLAITQVGEYNIVRKMKKGLIPMPYRVKIQVTSFQACFADICSCSYRKRAVMSCVSDRLDGRASLLSLSGDIRKRGNSRQKLLIKVFKLQCVQSKAHKFRFGIAKKTSGILHKYY